MRFYTGQHRYYCGIDLHARTMYLCILDHESGQIAYSGASRPPIPEQSVHAFRRKASTDSGDVVLPFRRIPSTLGA